MSSEKRDGRGTAHDELVALVAAGAERAEEADALARALIARNPKHNIARFTPGGKQTLGTLELAYNTLAHNALHRSRTNEGLLEALAFAKEGLRLDHERPDWLFDTAVRILLALLRPNDAFVIVEEATRLFPKTNVFADLMDQRLAWAHERTPAHDARALTAAHQKKAHDGETFADVINRANRWLRALYEAGFQTSVEIALGDAPVAVKRVHEPITPSAVRDLETELGLSLPPSYARFLTEIGGVAFLNPWWDATTAPDEIVAKSQTLAGIDMPSCPVWQSTKDLRLVRVCDHHNGQDWIYLCHFVDHRGEAPTFLRYHDEGELSFGYDLTQLEAIVAGVPTTASSKAGGGGAALANELTDALEDESLSQRDKLKLLQTEWAPRLRGASDDDVLAVLHLVRRRIKSKRLRDERDALLGELRRDGETGDAPLPSLDESLRPDKEKPPPRVAPVFETFHQWLQARVDEMMDEVVDRISPLRPR